MEAEQIMLHYNKFFYDFYDLSVYIGVLGERKMRIWMNKNLHHIYMALM